MPTQTPVAPNMTAVLPTIAYPRRRLRPGAHGAGSRDSAPSSSRSPNSTTSKPASATTQRAAELAATRGEIVLAEQEERVHRPGRRLQVAEDGTVLDLDVAHARPSTSCTATAVHRTPRTTPATQVASGEPIPGAHALPREPAATGSPRPARISDITMVTGRLRAPGQVLDDELEGGIAEAAPRPAATPATETPQPPRPEEGRDQDGRQTGEGEDERRVHERAPWGSGRRAAPGSATHTGARNSRNMPMATLCRASPRRRAAAWPSRPAHQEEARPNPRGRKGAAEAGARQRRCRGRRRPSRSGPRAARSPAPSSR